MELIKSVRIRERYSKTSTDYKVSMYKSGITGNKRILTIYPKIWDDLEIKEKEFTIINTSDEYIFYYINLNRKNSAYPNNPTTSPSILKIFNKWVPVGVDGSTSTVTYSDYKGLESTNSTDKNYVKYNDGFPTYYEILVDPYLESSGPKKRSFGFDPYYLNNGSKIEIKWIWGVDKIGGVDFSNNWGVEMNPVDIGLTPKDQKIDYKKTVVIYPPDNIGNKPFSYFSNITDVYDGKGTSPENKIREDFGFSYIPSGAEVDTLYKNGELIYEDKVWIGINDDKILNEIISKWSQKYGNNKLEVVKNEYGYYTNLPSKTTLDWVDPNQIISSTISYATPSNNNIYATGSTNSESVNNEIKSERVSGSFIFDVTLIDRMVNKEMGIFTITEKEDIDPFIFGESDSVPLALEYQEGEFAGQEESLITESQEIDSFDPIAAAEADRVAMLLEDSIPVSIGNWKLDLIPGNFITNGGSKIQCCQIDGAAINVKIAPAFLDMKEAAKKDGVYLKINSGFRSPYDSINTKSSSGVKVTSSSQDSLYKSYLSGKGNVAAKPGKSNHGNGIGLDLNTGGKSSSRFSNVDRKIYTWLVKNSWRFGFIRAVSSEEWHYDYLPDLAKNGPYGKLPNTDKGLVSTKFYKDWDLDNLKIG